MDIQYQFSRLVQALDENSLRFLKSKYQKELYRYRKEHNLNQLEYAQEYKRLQQRLKMITTELKLRKKLKQKETDVYFNGDYLVITTPDGRQEKYVVLEGCDDIILRRIE